MLTTKTINNQNAVTNAVLGTDDNSTTTINGNLLIKDTNGNSTTISPTGITGPTNATLNNLTVNGTSDFNSGAVYYACMQIRDLINNTFSQIFHSFNTLTIQSWTANGRIRISTTEQHQV